MRRLLFGMTLLLLLLMAGVQAQQPAEAQNPNLLRNPGFEGTYSAWLPQFTTAQVAPEWTPWWKNDLNANPQIAMPEWKPAHKRDFAYRVFEGDTAQAWFTFHRSHYGGMYQQVSGLEVGATYRFQVHVQAWNSASSGNPRQSDRPGDPRFRVGIQPNGEAIPGLVASEPAGIIWSGLAPIDQILDKYMLMSVEAVALRDTITVYMNSNPQYANKHNDYYIDAASLVKVADAPNTPPPAPTTPPPAPTAAPPSGGNNGGNNNNNNNGGAFTARTTRWTNVYTQPGGSPTGVLPPNTSVALHQTTQAQDWYEISANGLRGWVPASALTNINTGGSGGGGGTGGGAAATGNATVKSWTNVYDSPGGARRNGVALAPGTSVTVSNYDGSGNWANVSGGFGTGWVPKSALNVSGGGNNSGGNNSGGNNGNARPTGSALIQNWTNVYESPAGQRRSGVALAPNQPITVHGYNDAGNWADVSGNFGRGWIPKSSINQSSFGGSSGGGGNDSGGSSPAPTPVPPQPTPVAPSPVTGNFELGGQTHSFGNSSLMSDVGMNWVKFQHKWGEGNTGNEVAARISDAHSKGFKVLLSMPGSPYPSSIDFNAYVQFLGRVASLPDPPDAIEIWNEMNIDFEWPAGQISASQYLNQMLKPGYQAIKAANPNIMVISGAPAPTGFFGGGCAAQGCDDKPYMEELARLGGAQYMDCIGVHYNAGATSPNATSGHPADGGARHYSWYYQPMVDAYYNAFNGQRPLCFTEIGYLSGEDYGGVPARFAWAGDTSVSEHAQWLGEAVAKARNSGKVRMFIIFNVDFTLYERDGDPQAGYAMIRPGGGCPACQTIKAAMGR